MSVRLRPYRETDIGELTAAVRESVAEMQPWLPWCRADFSPAEAEEWILRAREAWRRRREFNFAVVGDDGSLLGTCSINQVHPVYPLANVGYWVRTSAAGRGVATAAVRHIADFARAETHLVRLEILAAVGNAASCRVAEKAGATLEGRLRARIVLHGTPRDAYLYALILDGEAAPQAGDERPRGGEAS